MNIYVCSEVKVMVRSITIEDCLKVYGFRSKGDSSIDNRKRLLENIWVQEKTQSQFKSMILFVSDTQKESFSLFGGIKIISSLQPPRITKPPIHSTKGSVLSLGDTRKEE